MTCPGSHSRFVKRTEGNGARKLSAEEEKMIEKKKKAARGLVSKDTKRVRKKPQRERDKGLAERGKNLNKCKARVLCGFTPSCSVPRSLRQERVGRWSNI